jgi:hypothetical protein
MRLSEVDMQEHESACEYTLSTHRVLLEVHLAENDVLVESQDLHVHVIKAVQGCMASCGHLRDKSDMNNGTDATLNRHS